MSTSRKVTQTTWQYVQADVTDRSRAESESSAGYVFVLSNPCPVDQTKNDTLFKKPVTVPLQIRGPSQKPTNFTENDDLLKDHPVLIQPDVLWTDALASSQAIPVTPLRGSEPNQHPEFVSPKGGRLKRMLGLLRHKLKGKSVNSETCSSSSSQRSLNKQGYLASPTSVQRSNGLSGECMADSLTPRHPILAPTRGPTTTTAAATTTTTAIPISNDPHRQTLSSSRTADSALGESFGSSTYRSRSCSSSVKSRSQTTIDRSSPSSTGSRSTRTTSSTSSYNNFSATPGSTCSRPTLRNRRRGGPGRFQNIDSENGVFDNHRLDSGNGRRTDRENPLINRCCHIDNQGDQEGVDQHSEKWRRRVTNVNGCPIDNCCSHGLKNGCTSGNNQNFFVSTTPAGTPVPNINILSTNTRGSESSISKLPFVAVEAGRGSTGRDSIRRVLPFQPCDGDCQSSTSHLQHHLLSPTSAFEHNRIRDSIFNTTVVYSNQNLLNCDANDRTTTTNRSSLPDLSSDDPDSSDYEEVFAPSGGDVALDPVYRNPSDFRQHQETEERSGDPGEKQILPQLSRISDSIDAIRSTSLFPLIPRFFPTSSAEPTTKSGTTTETAATRTAEAEQRVSCSTGSGRYRFNVNFWNRNDDALNSNIPLCTPSNRNTRKNDNNFNTESCRSGNNSNIVAFNNTNNNCYNGGDLLPGRTSRACPLVAPTGSAIQASSGLLRHTHSPCDDKGTLIPPLFSRTDKSVGSNKVNNLFPNDILIENSSNHANKNNTSDTSGSILPFSGATNNLVDSRNFTNTNNRYRALTNPARLVRSNASVFVHPRSLKVYPESMETSLDATSSIAVLSSTSKVTESHGTPQCLSDLLASLAPDTDEVTLDQPSNTNLNSNLSQSSSTGNRKHCVDQYPNQRQNQNSNQRQSHNQNSIQRHYLDQNPKQFGRDPDQQYQRHLFALQPAFQHPVESPACGGPLDDASAGEDGDIDERASGSSQERSSCEGRDSVSPLARDRSDDGSSGRGGGGFEPCHINMEERLLQTAAIWYLPDLHRLGAVHLLQGQPVGCFIVRQSSKSSTLAITVRLPPSKGPHVEHYLIEVHHTTPSGVNVQQHPTPREEGGGEMFGRTPPPPGVRTASTPTTNHKDTDGGGKLDVTFGDDASRGNRNISDNNNPNVSLDSDGSLHRSSETNHPSTNNIIGRNNRRPNFNTANNNEALFHTNTTKSSSTVSSSGSSSSTPVLTYSLEASDNRFDSASALIAHYASCCDELPVQLTLPKKLQDAKSRKELHSLALLGQEYWRTAGAVTTSTPSGSSPPNLGAAPTASPPLEAPPTRHLPPPHGGSAVRPVDLNFVSFSSFGKSGVVSSSNVSLFSPATHHSTSDSCSNLQTPADCRGQGLTATSVFPNQQAGDRSSLHLNLAPLDDILKEPPTFLSFKGGSQQGTPMTPLRPHPPLRVSPPLQQSAALHSPALQTPTVIQSPTVLQLQTSSNSVHTPTSTISFSRSSSINCQRSNSISNNPPTPPPRWAKSTLSTPNSNGTITTTLTFPVNQVKELPLGISEGGELQVTSDREELMEQTYVVEQQEQVCRMHVTELIAGTPLGGPHDPHHVGSVPNSFLESCVSSSFKASGVMHRHRDHLDLHIRQSFMSPQSTPCTPCNPTTPISTPLSEEGGESRARLRKTHKDRRRHSNHYHDVNVIDNTRCYRSSLADKISDYEDVWSSPPRDSPSSKDSPSPKKISRKMSTFKPNADISKSLGDLSDISQNKSAMFIGDNDSIQDDNPRIGEMNGNNSFDSIPSFRNTNSPFYVEPADCLRESENRARIKKTPSNKILTRKIANRFSDSNIQWRARQNRNLMSKIESNENLNGLSSSAENLMNGFDTENDINAPNAKNFPPSRRGHRQLQHRTSRGKPVAPPRVLSDNHIVSGSDDPNRPPWRLDSSWRYQSCDSTPVGGQTTSGGGKSANSGSPSGDARFPLLELNGECESVITGEKTVFDLITEKLPNLPLPTDTQSITISAVTKVSEYDNVAIRNHSARTSESMNNHINNNNNNNNHGNLKVSSPAGHCLSSSISDSGTEFSEPWDSRKWDSLLQTDDESSIEPISLSGTPARPQLEEWDRRLNAVVLQQVAGESGAGSDDDTSSVSPGPMIPLVHGRHLDSSTRSKILSPQLLALRHRQDAESGASIRKYSLQLGTDSSAMFAQNIEQFISCTLETSERDPEVVVRNVRQFMSGMKNYLVTSGEKQFEDIVRKERSTLKATEFLNLDAILEDVLVRLVLRRLWHHITALYVDAFTVNESIQRLANNMTFARSLHPEKLGIRAGLSLPTGPVLEDLKRLLAKMQRVYAPREKLELLLTAISLLYHTLSEASVPFTGDADDLVPMMIWVLSHCGFFSAEIEADYMTGLLLTSSSCGEARYYLTAFHSAIHSLKNLAPSPESTPGNSLDSVRQDASLLPEPGTLKIIVPDEHNGSIVSRSLPVRPNTTSKELCKMMAHKMRVTNPQDYGLYKLVDGVESALSDNECPHTVRSDLSHRGLHCIIAFKRTDAKIAWPIVRE